MTNEEVKKNIWRNSISNYVCMALKLSLGLVMFRLLFQGLTREEFGFWSLLWSVFGYGILLDFGFGFTAEKRVAELSVHQRWEHLSKILSTIFFVYLGLGLLIIAAAWGGSHWLIQVFQITPENRERFRTMLVWFACGMGVTFPLGIFPEILIGQQRIALVNVIFSSGIVGNFIGLALAMHFHWGMKVILIIGLLSGIIPSAVSALFALRQMPSVRIHPKFFSLGMIRETTKFSIFAYLITVSNILLAKTDQLVISTVLAVSAVSLYQAGAKIGEMFGMFAQLLPSTFSPVAAHLHAKGDKEFLRSLLINGTRFSVMIATPVYFICAFYMEGLLRILTGAKAPSHETFLIGQTLLFWGYTALITQSVTKRIFVMCGHEKKLMRLTVAEAALNLALSIGLILYFKNVLCVALGSLISTLFIGWFYLWPWAAREVNLSGWQLAQTVLFPIWLACLPLLGFLSAGRFVPWLDFRASTILFILESLLALLVAAASLWRGALTTGEREHLLMKVGKIFARSTAV